MNTIAEGINITTRNNIAHVEVFVFEIERQINSIHTVSSCYHHHYYHNHIISIITIIMMMIMILSLSLSLSLSLLSSLSSYYHYNYYDDDNNIIFIIIIIISLSLQLLSSVLLNQYLQTIINTLINTPIQPLASGMRGYQFIAPGGPAQRYILSTLSTHHSCRLASSVDIVTSGTWESDIILYIVWCCYNILKILICYIERRLYDRV